MSGLGRRVALPFLVSLAWSLSVVAAETPPEPPASSTPEKSIPHLALNTGDLQTIPVEDPVRVAISDPKVADVTIVSDREVLLQAKQAGNTNLIVWDKNGQRAITITVVGTETAPIYDQLTHLLDSLKLDRVHVRQEGETFFLIGEVDSEQQFDQLERLLNTYKNAKNLVKVTPPPQPVAPAPAPAQLVRLQVQIVELSKDFKEQLGVDWAHGIGFKEQTFVAGPSGTVSTTDALNKLGVPFHTRVGTPFQVGRLFREGFSATVNFLTSKGKARILAEPTLVTASGKPATSFMGTEIPIISTTTTGLNTGAVSSEIEFREVGVKLTMTPTVADPHEKITTALKAEVTGIDESRQITVGAGGSQTVKVPGFRTRRAETEVVTNSGETIVIAGLLQSEDSLSVSEVPGLGTMPVLGRLFKTPTTQNTQTELVIAVTPELVADETMVTERRLALEQALASAEVTASVEDPRLRYALTVQDRIAKAIRYPMRERELNIEGTVKLRLHLFADGTLGRAMVAESSGVQSLDAEALKAAESQSPYPGFPIQLIERELWLEVPVIFRPT